MIRGVREKLRECKYAKTEKKKNDVIHSRRVKNHGTSGLRIAIS